MTTPGGSRARAERGQAATEAFDSGIGASPVRPTGIAAHPRISPDGGPEPQGPQAALPGDVTGAHGEDQPAG